MSSYGVQNQISCFLNGESIVTGISVEESRIASMYPVRVHTDTMILHLQTCDITSLEKAVSELHIVQAERERNGRI